MTKNTHKHMEFIGAEWIIVYYVFVCYDVYCAVRTTHNNRYSSLSLIQ